MDEQFNFLIKAREEFSAKQSASQSTKQSRSKNDLKNLKKELEGALKNRKANVMTFFNEHDHKIVVVDDFISSYEEGREDEYRDMILKLMHEANDSNSPLLILDPIVEKRLPELIRKTDESNEQSGSEKRIDNPICYASGQLIANPLFD